VAKGSFMSELISDCRELLQAERYDEALQLLSGLTSPRSEEKALRGRALSGLGRFAEAREVFNEALADDSRCHEALAGLGLLAWLSGHHHAALEKFDAAVALQPGNGRYRGLRGLVQAQLKNSSAALEDFQAAYALGDRDPAPMLARAQLLLVQGDLAGGREAIEQARQNGAEEGALGSLEGALRRLTGDHSGALQGYQAALARDPSRVQLWWEVLGLVSQVDRSRLGDMLTSALSHHPDDERILILAAAKWREDGRMEESLRLLEEAVQRQPDNQALLVFLGTYLREVDRTEEALRCFERALARNPESARAHFGRALACQDREVALESFRRAVELEPENVVFQYHFGAVLSGMGRYTEALEPLGRAVELDPSFWRAYHERSICYESLGRFASAQQERELCEAARAKGRDLPADLDPLA
jgi:tetratricopeptide (TPR) repeat protein